MLLAPGASVRPDAVLSSLENRQTGINGPENRWNVIRINGPDHKWTVMRRTPVVLVSVVRWWWGVGARCGDAACARRQRAP